MTTATPSVGYGIFTLDEMEKAGITIKEN